MTRWPDATNDEVIDSVVPVATGLAAVAAATPPDVRAYHASGQSTAADFIGRAWRRDWGRALTWLWLAPGLWSFTTAAAGGWALVSAHQRWWAYPWVIGWAGAGLTFLILAGKAGEAADREQKLRDLQREREDARRLGAENARRRRQRLASQRAGKDSSAGTGSAETPPSRPGGTVRAVRPHRRDR